MTAGSEFRGMADRFRAAPEQAVGMIRDATATAAPDTQRVARAPAPGAAREARPAAKPAPSRNARNAPGRGVLLGK